MFGENTLFGLYIMICVLIICALLLILSFLSNSKIFRVVTRAIYVILILAVVSFVVFVYFS